MVSSTLEPSSFFSTATVWVTLNLPAWMDSTVPDRRGGTMILCSTTAVSWTVPRMSPPVTLSPGLATGTKSHSFSRSRAGTSTPRSRVFLPVCFMMTSSGRWMPS